MVKWYRRKLGLRRSWLSHEGLLGFEVQFECLGLKAIKVDGMMMIIITALSVLQIIPGAESTFKLVTKWC